MKELYGLADECDGHTHAVIYDPITGFGHTTTDAGHHHNLENFELSEDKCDLHTHDFVLATKLDEATQFHVEAHAVLDAQDAERTREQKIESCVMQLKKKGTSKSKAFAICTAAQNKKKDEVDVGPGAGMGPGGKCVCPKCGAKVAHQRGKPCVTVKCPKCGAKMTRAT